MSLSNTDCFSVYCLRFSNGKLYFGISSDIKKRLRQHKNSENQKPTKRPIIHAIQKHGWSSVEVEILHSNLSPEAAYRIESELISKYETQDFSKGYNIASGGRTNFGYKHPNVWSKGAKFSDEHKLKLSEAKKEDAGLKDRASDASSKYPVIVTNLKTGIQQTFKNVNVAARAIGVQVMTARNHVIRNSLKLAKEWQIRRIQMV